jgi:hypothetical protein
MANDYHEGSPTSSKPLRSQSTHDTEGRVGIPGKHMIWSLGVVLASYLDKPMSNAVWQQLQTPVAASRLCTLFQSSLVKVGSRESPGVVLDCFESKAKLADVVHGYNIILFSRNDRETNWYRKRDEFKASSNEIADRKSNLRCVTLFRDDGRFRVTIAILELKDGLHITQHITSR